LRTSSFAVCFHIGRVASDLCRVFASQSALTTGYSNRISTDSRTGLPRRALDVFPIVIPGTESTFKHRTFI
jgi:hypothetical protein